jgi:Ring finger domain
MFLFRRHQARFQSERVANSESQPDGTSTTNIITSVTAISQDSHDEDDEEGAFVNTNTTPYTGAPAIDNDSESRPDPSNGQVQPRVVAMGDDDDGSDEEDNSERIDGHYIRHTVTLAELEEERELARRRSSACLLFALFVLFRLWIFALQEGDFGLLLLCVMASSWTARWIRHGREQEEELDRRIAQYIQNAEHRTDGTGRDSLRMLSFQAQLALAIMESQRQMMQGGYGHPDGGANQDSGVSDATRAKWKKFEFKSSRDELTVSQRRGSYGSVTQGDGAKSSSCDEEPNCSICLGEYENGEELCTLPCGHVYHTDCIGSWCTNHTRCPLCNTDLEAAEVDSA